MRHRHRRGDNDVNRTNTMAPINTSTPKIPLPLVIILTLTILLGCLVIYRFFINPPNIQHSPFTEKKNLNVSELLFYSSQRFLMCNSTLFFPLKLIDVNVDEYGETWWIFLSPERSPLFHAYDPKFLTVGYGFDHYSSEDLNAIRWSILGRYSSLPVNAALSLLFAFLVNEHPNEIELFPNETVSEVHLLEVNVTDVLPEPHFAFTTVPKSCLDSLDSGIDFFSSFKSGLPFCMQSLLDSIRAPSPKRIIRSNLLNSQNWIVDMAPGDTITHYATTLSTSTDKHAMIDFAPGRFQLISSESLELFSTKHGWPYRISPNDIKPVSIFGLGLEIRDKLIEYSTSYSDIGAFWHPSTCMMEDFIVKKFSHLNERYGVVKDRLLRLKNSYYKHITGKIYTSIEPVEFSSFCLPKHKPSQNQESKTTSKKTNKSKRKNLNSLKNKRKNEL